MRTAEITVYNNQKLEVFVEKRKDYFEIWTVGPIKGHRMLLDHHLTHDDLEARLEYAKPGDVVWRDADCSELPVLKHPRAMGYEKTVKREFFLDFENMLQEINRSVTGHLAGIIFLITDRRELRAAKKILLGRWTDGVLTMGLEPNNKIEWSCTDQNHRLNWEFREHVPDWWNFAMWRLGLMNMVYKCGTHVGVLRVDDQELHLHGGSPHRLARIFRRV